MTPASMSSIMVSSLLTKKVRSRPGTTEINFGSLSSWKRYAMNPPDLTDAGSAFHPGTSWPGPKFFAGNARAFGHGFQFCPHDAWMHAPVELLLRKSAVGASNHVLSPDDARKSHDPFGD